MRSASYFRSSAIINRRCSSNNHIHRSPVSTWSETCKRYLSKRGKCYAWNWNGGGNRCARNRFSRCRKSRSFHRPSIRTSCYGRRFHSLRPSDSSRNLSAYQSTSSTMRRYRYNYFWNSHASRRRTMSPASARNSARWLGSYRVTNSTRWYLLRNWLCIQCAPKNYSNSHARRALKRRRSGSCRSGSSNSNSTSGLSRRNRS